MGGRWRRVCKLEDSTIEVGRGQTSTIGKGEVERDGGSRSEGVGEGEAEGEASVEGI